MIRWSQRKKNVDGERQKSTCPPWKKNLSEKEVHFHRERTRGRRKKKSSLLCQDTGDSSLPLTGSRKGSRRRKKSNLKKKVPPVPQKPEGKRPKKRSLEGAYNTKATGSRSLSCSKKKACQSEGKNGVTKGSFCMKDPGT